MDRHGGAINRLDWNVNRSRSVIAMRVEQLEEPRVLGTILLIILILLLLGALPAWPYSSGWGYYPSGGIGLLLVILIVLLVAGRI
jgi:Protein of unknown function (DUF3309)